MAAAHAHGCVVLHDLAYDRLTFDGHEATSVLSAPGARDVAVELWSPSKVYGMAGWRIGFLVGAAEVVGRVQALIDHATAGVWTGLQRGLEAALHVGELERLAALQARGGLRQGQAGAGQHAADQRRDVGPADAGVTAVAPPRPG